MKSLNYPPQIKELSPFENELFNLLKIIKFREVQSEFQRKLKQDIQRINSESKTITFADKTTTIHQREKEHYKKLLKDSITTTCKKVNGKIGKQINVEGKSIIKDKTIGNRILQNSYDECFISRTSRTIQKQD